MHLCSAFLLDFAPHRPFLREKTMLRGSECIERIKRQDDQLGESGLPWRGAKIRTGVCVKTDRVTSSLISRV